MALLDLPEFIHALAPYLTQIELAYCTRVNTSWRSLFIPYFWRTVDDRSRLFHPTYTSRSAKAIEDMIEQDLGPVPAAVDKYAHHIQTLCITLAGTVYWARTSARSRLRLTSLYIRPCEVILHSFRYRALLSATTGSLSSSAASSSESSLESSTKLLCPDIPDILVENAQVQWIEHSLPDIKELTRLCWQFILDQANSLQELTMDLAPPHLRLEEKDESFLVDKVLARLKGLRQLSLLHMVGRHDFLVRLPEVLPRLEKLCLPNLSVETMDCVKKVVALRNIATENGEEKYRKEQDDEQQEKALGHCPRHHSTIKELILSGRILTVDLAALLKFFPGLRRFRAPSCVDPALGPRNYLGRTPPCRDFARVKAVRDTFLSQEASATKPTGATAAAGRAGHCINNPETDDLVYDSLPLRTLETYSIEHFLASPHLSQFRFLDLRHLRLTTLEDSRVLIALLRAFPALETLSSDRLKGQERYRDLAGLNFSDQVWNPILGSGSSAGVDGPGRQAHTGPLSRQLKLKVFKIETNTYRKSVFAPLLERMPDLVEVRIQSGYPDMLMALGRTCSGTLEIVWMNVREPCPTQVETLLQSCPRLRELTGMGLAVREAYICTETRPWACTERLEKLQCEIWVEEQVVLTEYEDQMVRNSGVMDPLTGEVHLEWRALGLTKERLEALEKFRVSREDHFGPVFEQLGRLTGLRYLDIGFQRRVLTKKSQCKPRKVWIPEKKIMVRYYDQPVWGSLELSLRAGLSRLEGLKRLKVLGFQGVNHRIQEVDLEWMVRSWPDLTTVLGLEGFVAMGKQMDEGVERLREKLEGLKPELDLPLARGVC